VSTLSGPPLGLSSSSISAGVSPTASTVFLMYTETVVFPSALCHCAVRLPTPPTSPVGVKVDPEAMSPTSGRS
jgi:hypothetical protein